MQLCSLFEVPLQNFTTIKHMSPLCCSLINPLKRFSSYIPKRVVHNEHKVRVNGLDINIVESGSGNKNVLLMPGALGSCWTDFKPQIEQLPTLLPNHTVVAWDPPGYGKSIPPKRQWGLEVFHNDARCALDLMKTLGRARFSVVGWSGGGITGLIMAGLYRDNIEKLILWGAGAYVIPEEVKTFENIRDVSNWSADMRAPMEEIYGVERFAELWSEWVDAVCAFYKERNGDICKREVEQIIAPTFLLRGKKDPVISRAPGQYLRERIKRIK